MQHHDVARQVFPTALSEEAVYMLRGFSNHVTPLPDQSQPLPMQPTLQSICLLSSASSRRLLSRLGLNAMVRGQPQAAGQTVFT